MQLGSTSMQYNTEPLQLNYQQEREVTNKLRVLTNIAEMSCLVTTVALGIKSDPGGFRLM